jgi:hypothetical protein
MRRLEAVSWVLSLCYALRLSQAKTLADLVGSALSVARVSLANLGRNLLGDSHAKHKIKRTWRFCANDRVAVSDAMSGLIKRLRKAKKKKPLLVALDWVEVRCFHTLMLCVVHKGRALPLLWESYTERKLRKSRNALEEGMLLLLRDMVPSAVEIILLADRGFGRAELARRCQALGIRYLIRIKPDVCIEHPSFCGLLSELPVKKGMARLLKQVRYRQEDPVSTNVVIRWKRGLPRKRDEPWFLFTDLGLGAVKLTELYGKRMTIEEFFRDGKNKRNGMALRDTKITKPERLDRLLLILALAYWLLVGVGLLAQGRYRPGMWCSSNDPKQCSAFTVGRIVLDRLRVSAAAAFAAAVQGTLDVLDDIGKLGTT